MGIIISWGDPEDPCNEDENTIKQGDTYKLEKREKWAKCKL